MNVARNINNALRAWAPGLGAFLEAVLLLVGAAGISYGAWQAYAPAGPMVGGALLITGIILRARGNP